MEKCSIGFSSLRRFDKMEYNWYANKHTSYHREVTMEKKTISDMRRKIRRLHQKLSTLGPLMRGTVVLLGSTCGNPRCKCARGEKHPQYYFSVNIDRRTKTMYLRKEMKSKAEEYVKNYKLLWHIVEEMTLLNFELLKSKKPQP
jgi:hypothetical protein